MKRDHNKIDSTSFDLIIIGGGITGAFAAWDAALRGLDVVLIEKGDFGAGTSAASGKIIHGGIRYMQYGAFHRVRESLHERMVFRNIAPHFVHPIPFLIPTYGHLMRGKEVLKLGMIFYDLLSVGKRNSKDMMDMIPRHRLLTKREVLELEPGLETEDPNGGVLYYDCQMHNPERLTLSVLLAASFAGAKVFNYTQVTGSLMKSGRVIGVKTKDKINGCESEIRGRVVLNAAGPWAGEVVEVLSDCKPPFRVRYSKGIHIITRSITYKLAVALASKHKNVKAMMQRGGRHFFIVPWRNHSLIGTTNVPYYKSADAKMVTEEDISDLIEEVNTAYPACGLRREDVVYQYGGLYLDDEKHAFKAGYQGGRKDYILDHSRTHGIENLLTTICVKYTTARKLSSLAVDSVFRKLGYEPPKCRTEEVKIYGGDIPQFKDYLAQETTRQSDTLQASICRNLILNYGSVYSALLDYIDFFPDANDLIHDDFPIIKSQVIHAVRKEMARKLADVVFRRTGLGTIGNPGDEALRVCVNIMANELAWDGIRIQQELDEVKEAFSPG
jgi:glycerol-3-phosphate dehydrogenase